MVGTNCQWPWQDKVNHATRNPLVDLLECSLHWAGAAIGQVSHCRGIGHRPGWPATGDNCCREIRGGAGQQKTQDGGRGVADLVQKISGAKLPIVDNAQNPAGPLHPGRPESVERWPGNDDSRVAFVLPAARKASSSLARATGCCWPATTTAPTMAPSMRSMTSSAALVYDGLCRASSARSYRTPRRSECPSHE